MYDLAEKKNVYSLRITTSCIDYCSFKDWEEGTLHVPGWRNLMWVQNMLLMHMLIKTLSK